MDVLTQKCPSCDRTLIASGTMGDDKAFCPNAACPETVFHLRGSLYLK